MPPSKDAVFNKLMEQAEPRTAPKMACGRQVLQGCPPEIPFPRHSVPQLSLNDAERLGSFQKESRSPQGLLPFMRRAHNRPQPRLAFRHDRVTHGGCKDSRFEKFL